MGRLGGICLECRFCRYPKSKTCFYQGEGMLWDVGRFLCEQEGAFRFCALDDSVVGWPREML